MGKSTPQAPTPPDPVVVANAQAAANTQTAQEQQRLNMVGTAGPQGTVGWSPDPSQPGGFTQTTTLSPGQQQLYDAQTGIQNQALGVAQQQVGRVGDALGGSLTPPTLQGGVQTSAPFNPGQIQGGVNVQRATGDIGQTPGYQQTFDQGQALQGNIGNSAVQHQVGPTDFTKDREAVTDSVWHQALSRLDPMYGQRQQSLDTRLANQGIGVNSAAYGNAQDIEGRGRNDAYNQALYSGIQQGANEQNTLFGQSLAQGQFANAAAGQEFGQGLQQGQFHNAASGQQYAQNQGQAVFGNTAADQAFQQAAARGQFGNQAAAQNTAQDLAAMQFANAAQEQGFGQQQAQNDQRFGQDLQAAQFGNQAAQQGFQNTSYAQSQPINNLSALLGLSQVQGPQGINYSPTQVGQTDVLGANALATQARQAAYNSQMQNQTSLLGGLSQLGSAAIRTYSDRRLKRDIVKLGQLSDGLGVYRYRYLWSPQEFIGVMAQEVAKLRPWALGWIGPWMAVDYGAL